MKILYVSTVAKTMTFFIRQIDRLQDLGHTVEIAANSGGETAFSATKTPCVIHPVDFSRSPTSRSNLSAYRALKALIRRGGYDLIHTHTPIASALVRLACRRRSGPKVIYTAHGFHFYRGAPFLNWAMYYPLEKWLARYTDVLITINREDYERAKRRLPAGRVEYVPGVGIDIAKFKDEQVDAALIRQELGIPEDAVVLLSVGELNANKNHELVVRALGEMKDPGLHYLICGTGPMRQVLLDLAASLGIGDRFHLLGFRSDVAAMYKISDLFILPSLREGLPVALMEAMASGLPSLASRIRGNTDLFEGSSGEGLFDPRDKAELTAKLKRAVRERRLTGKAPADEERMERFSTRAVLAQMDRIYGI